MSSSTDNNGNGAKTDVVKKFLFDTNDFDRQRLVEQAAPTFTEEQMALAKSQSYNQGKADGMKDTRMQQEERISQLLQVISQHVEKMAAAEDRREMEKMIDVTKLAMRVMHKLLPQFAERYALPEIESIILKSLESRRDEPRIAVMVPITYLDGLKERIDTVALEKGYAGKVILMADDTLPPTDCRVEWADGGAERLYERLLAQIETEFTKAIAGMDATLNTKK